MKLSPACKVLYIYIFNETKVICRVFFAAAKELLFIWGNEALHIYSGSLKSKIFCL